MTRFIVSNALRSYPFERFNPSFETIPLHYYLIRLVTQFVIPLHVHHFPVYYPTEEERADAALYAENVRTVRPAQLSSSLPRC